jgi:hypothetical protein
MGRLRGVSREGLVQGWRNRGPGGSTVRDAKLGSDGPPRRGRRVKGQSWRAAWRVIFQNTRGPLFSTTCRAGTRLRLV